ncbi:fimbrial protein, partial [Escherichia coli]|uniref:fimbrial protein n=3 Tax=Escherichia coli TaxID=562 RepID=UPI00359C160A
GLTALSAEFTIGEGELMAHDVPLGCAPDEYDDLISGTCSHLPYNSDDFQFVWNIYANNDVVVPTGGCDVSARDVTVTLPDYPGSVPIPLTVYCAKSQNLGYYLSGTTVDAGNSIFTNTASFSPAQGVGVQLTRNGTIIPANNTVSLGAVGTSAVSLGLTANYARTGGQVTAGNVQSIIGVTFVYQ